MERGEFRESGESVYILRVRLCKLRMDGESGQKGGQECVLSRSENASIRLLDLCDCGKTHVALHFILQRSEEPLLLGRLLGKPHSRIELLLEFGPILLQQQLRLLLRHERASAALQRSQRSGIRSR